MKIYTDNFLYRLIERYHGIVPDDLCQFFWRACIVIVMHVWLWGVALTAGVLVGYMLATPFLYYYFGVPVSFDTLVGGYIFWAILTILYGWFLYSKYKPIDKLAKSDNIVIQMIRAKKERVCPRIEFIKRV